MNGRERFFAVLNSGEVDHVPVRLLFPYHPVNYYADVKNIPRFKPVIELFIKLNKDKDSNQSSCDSICYN